MPALREVLEYAQLTAGNTAESLLNLNDESHYFIESGTFKVIPGTRTAVIAQDERRWGGGHQVAETDENGSIQWTAGVAGKSEQECVEKVEAMLKQVEANPYRLFIKWQMPGVAQPSLFEVRGVATWIPEYEWATFEGAQLFLFNVSIPVAPLVLGLPQKLYEKANLTLPELLSIGTVPGDAPAKAEVIVETGATFEESFITGQHEPHGIVSDGTHLYWCNTETGFIGRATVAGGTVEPTWVKTEGSPTYLAVDSGHVYWTDPTKSAIGRCTTAGASIEKSWITLAHPAAGVAVNSEHIYFCVQVGAHIGRAAIGGTGLEETWVTLSATGGVPYGLAINTEHIYVGRQIPTTGAWKITRLTLAGGSEEVAFVPEGVGQYLAIDAEHIYGGSSSQETVERFSLSGGEAEPAYASAPKVRGITVASSELYISLGSNIARISAGNPPVWGLIGVAPKPSAGLATAPFGILNDGEAVGVTGWASTANSGARGGTALLGFPLTAQAAWEVDPATMVPDAFSGELTVEVWAHILTGEGAGQVLTVSAQPQDGLSFGTARYSDEWGSGGRPVEAVSGTEKWRMTRLGTLHLLVNTLAPRIWKIVVNGHVESLSVPKWGIDYLVLVPSLARSCSPSGQPLGRSYPQFIPTVAAAVKTVKSDLSGLLAKPGKNGHPHTGLGGQVLEIPAGEAEMLLKLSSLVPDDPTLSATSEQVSHEAKVTVWVTPRYFLSRLT